LERLFLNMWQPTLQQSQLHFYKSLLYCGMVVNLSSPKKSDLVPKKAR